MGYQNISSHVCQLIANPDSRANAAPGGPRVTASRRYAIDGALFAD